MKYSPGQKVNISVISLTEQDSDLTFVNLAGSREELELYNDLGELCCLDGEDCIIDHVVVNSTDRGALYDLLNCNGETAVHFILSEMDLDIAAFTDFKSEELDIHLEIADLVDHTPDLSRITVDTQIFDNFARNAYITTQFEEKGDEIYLYKMLKRNNNGITMELIPEN